MINKIILQGRLTADPEVRQTQSGVAVCSFTVAWSDKYKEVETKCFLRCEAWRGTAEFLGKYFSKGQEIVIEGKLKTEEYQDKDGNNRTAQKCVVDGVNFCGTKKDNFQNIDISTGGKSTNVSGSVGEFEELETTEDLPF